jgi:hypothetical protein
MLLDKIVIGDGDHQKSIQLLCADLAALPAEDAVDVLVISAFNNNYVPVPSTVIGGLYKRGLSVEELAGNKKADLRKQYGCWLSADLTPQQQEQFHFKRILCFEPNTFSNKPYTVVGNIFRCINHFAFEKENNSVALSLISTGNMEEEIKTMFNALLEAALFWLRQGLPLETIKIVHHKKEIADDLQKYMQEFKGKNNLTADIAVAVSPPLKIEIQAPPEIPQERGADTTPVTKDDFEFDIFISYAHVNSDAVDAFIGFLNEIQPELKIFHDKESIEAGTQWFMRIYSSLDKSNRVVVFFSPAYFDSGPCIDEYQCAKARQYKLKKPVLLPVYLYNYDNMLTVFTLDQWLDCREGDNDKLNDACKKILAQIN